MDILVFGACFAIIATASKQIGDSLKKTGLPLVTGFLLTGIVAGPYVLGLITREATSNLQFLDEIALGFIAFAAGSELYLNELKSRIKTIALVTAGLVVCTFSLTGVTVFLLADSIPFMAGMPAQARVAVAILAGAILVARSPSSAIAIVNELRAKGPFTQTVLGVTIIMDVVVIVLFAANSSVADALLSGLDVNVRFVFLLVVEIGASIGIGYGVARVILAILALPLRQGIKAGSVLLTGYLVFVLAAGVRDFSHDAVGIEIFFEPLLICMVGGFIVANTASCRNEFAGILQEIGPAVYIMFFTLTGASLSLDVVARTWPIALVLFVVRAGAIFLGSFAGGVLAKNPFRDNRLSWMAYITQAGVGLGLAREVVVEFPDWGPSFAAIIISVIILNQMVGPPLFKFAIKRMNEDHPRAEAGAFKGVRDAVIFGGDGQAFALAMSLMSQGWQVRVAVTDRRDHQDRIGDLDLRYLPDLSMAELKAADCHRARAIVAMLSDAENFKVCEIAYEHFGTRTLIARLNDRNNFGCFQALGVLIVDPSTAIVSLLDHFVRAPAAASLLMGMNDERKISDILIRNPDLAGLALRDLRLPFDTVIMSVRRRGVLFVPHDYTRLEAGDLVTVVGSLQSLNEVALRFDVNHKQAILQIVERAAAKELAGPSVRTEVTELMDAGNSVRKDRFDLLVQNSQVMDLKQAMDKDAFFDRVSRAMSGPLSMPAVTLKDLLVKREEDITTVLAPGLAVPHIIIDGQGRFSILLARCRKGITFSAAMPPVYAAFVLVGTRDERDFHLRALSAIAQIVLDPGFEKKWMRAKTRAALKNVIITADRKRDPRIPAGG